MHPERLSGAVHGITLCCHILKFSALSVSSSVLPGTPGRWCRTSLGTLLPGVRGQGYLSSSPIPRRLRTPSISDLPGGGGGQSVQTVMSAPWEGECRGHEGRVVAAWALCIMEGE